MTSALTLPDDPEDLRALALALHASLQARTLQAEKLKAQLDRLRRARASGIADQYWTALSEGWDEPAAEDSPAARETA
jgi:hypothetical protein